LKELRQFIITGPAGLALGFPTLRGGSPGYAIAAAVVILLPQLLSYAFRLLPYGFALLLLLLRDSRPFTVDDHGVKIVSDGTISPSELAFDTCRPSVLGSPAINRSKGVRMLTAIDTAIRFAEVRLSTTDGKIKVRVNQCSACAALVPPMETQQHKRFHDDVRAIAQKAGMTR
jgi:hypothetical protein